MSCRIYVRQGDYLWWRWGYVSGKGRYETGRLATIPYPSMSDRIRGRPSAPKRAEYKFAGKSEIIIFALFYGVLCVEFWYIFHTPNVVRPR